MAGRAVDGGRRGDAGAHRFGAGTQHRRCNAGIPGLAMPAGMSRAGLPVGVELDGPLGSDRRLLAIGMAFEAVLGRVAAPAA